MTTLREAAQQALEALEADCGGRYTRVSGKAGAAQQARIVVKE